MKARFPIFARLERPDRPVLGTVTIDRDRGLFSVRPKRRRKEYTLPLDEVAQIVVHKLLKLEVREKLAAKRAKRKRRR